MGDASTPLLTGAASRAAVGRAARQRPDSVTQLHSWPVCQRLFPPPLPRFRILFLNWGAPLFRERAASQSLGRVSGRVPSAWDRQTVPARGRDTQASPLRATGLQFPEDSRQGSARPTLWTLLGLQSQPWALLGNHTKIQPVLFIDGETEAERPEGNTDLPRPSTRPRGGACESPSVCNLLPLRQCPNLHSRRGKQPGGMGQGFRSLSLAATER